MAPAALVVPQTDPIKTINTGQYKEQSAGPRTYVKEVEEKGSGEFEKATVGTTQYNDMMLLMANQLESKVSALSAYLEP